MSKSIITNDIEHCFICGNPTVAYHHVINGVANRKKSDKYGLIVPLCPRHHDEIHQNQKLDIKLKQLAQKKFEEVYGHEKFMEVFRKNYIEIP